MRKSLKTLMVAALAVSMAGSAYAQAINLLNDGYRRRTSDDVEKEQAIEKDYNAQMKKIPDQKQSSDPWGTVRSSDTTKQAPATTARKPKQQN